MDQAASFIKIELPEPQLGDPESFCRFCYSTFDLLSIFPTDGHPVQRVIDLVEQLLGIGLSVGEDFPSAICRQCHNKLEDFDCFRQKSKLYSDEIRKSRLGFIEDASVSVKYEDVTENGEDPTNLWRKKENKEPEMEVPVGEIQSKTAYGEWKTADEKPLFSGSSKPKIKSPAGQTGPLMRKLKQQAGLLRKPKKPALKVQEQDKRKPKPLTGQTGPLMKKLKQQAGLTRKSTKGNLHDPQDLWCKVCEQFFTNRGSINEHMKVHVDSTNLSCCYCQKSFPTMFGVLSHALKSYIMKSFPCQHCDVLFKSKESLLAHELYCDKNAAQTSAKINIVKEFQCEHCPKSFDTSIRLYYHTQIHDAKIVCSKCGSSFPSTTDLKYHEARYHSNGPEQIPTTVKCELCQRTFVDASAYRSHHTHMHGGDRKTRKLDEEKLYECDDCGKKFWSINTIRYHVLVHRKYRDCDQCSLSFRSGYELREHKMSFHPERCEFCPKKCFNKQSLRAHCNKMHGMLQIKHLTEDERVTYSWHKVLYKCACCELEYERFGQLKDHYGRSHPTEKVLVRCTKCDTISASIIGYMGHLTGDCGQTPKRFKAWH